MNEWPSLLWSGPRNRARTLLGLGILCTLCAWLAIPLIDVESVLISGPVLTIIGLTTILYGMRHGYHQVAAVGAGHVAICILFASLVNILSWGPNAAREPFMLMGAIYTMLMAPLSWLVGRAVPELRQFGACTHCGYLLYGLREPRCPECGQPFDPSWLPKLTSPPGTPPPPHGLLNGDGI
ncbi:MAG: hypothetical protein ACM359_02050 [Bacillota bacterium]